MPPAHSRPLPKPPWLRRPLGPGSGLEERLREAGLATVCQEALCPNRGECHGQGVATFLVMGRSCTRSCAFCAVGKGSPQALDPGEPLAVARAIAGMGLSYAVVTSVTRDDLPDGGAGHLAEVARRLRQEAPGVRLELLAPDFAGSREALATVVAAGPEVLSHNLETVPRLYARARAGADYARSLGLLARAREMAPGLLTKSGLMLGLGEEPGEVLATLEDLRGVDCRLLTLGQYLAPSPRHLPVARYVEPGEFDDLRRLALEMGFWGVASGPLVRSSYLAERGFLQAAQNQR